MALFRHFSAGETNNPGVSASEHFDNLRWVNDGGDVSLDDLNLAPSGLRRDGCDGCRDDLAGVKPDLDV